MKNSISKIPQTELKSPKIKALMNQIESGQLSTDSARILNYVKVNPGINIRTIEKHLTMKHQTASARVSGLQDLGLIEAKGEGRYSALYFVAEPSLQQHFRDLREREKFAKWLSKAPEFEHLLSPLQQTILRHLKTA